jgi:hypothetical protein
MIKSIQLIGNDGEVTIIVDGIPHPETFECKYDLDINLQELLESLLVKYYGVNG